MDRPPPLGFGAGTAWYGGKLGDAAMEAAIRGALSAGFRHLDLAEAYKTEAACGSAIEGWLRETGTPRDSLWITSKVSPQNATKLREHCLKSLGRIRVDHLDLYLLHAPFGIDDIPAAWAAMEALVDDGLCRYIGVSNFRQEDIEVLLKGARIKPLCNQIEHHPHLQQPDLLHFLKEHSIAVAAYSPLAPLTKIDEPTTLKQLLTELGEKYKVPTHEILLRWNLQRGHWVLTTTRSAAKCPRLLTVADQGPIDATDAAAISKAGAEQHLRCFWTKAFEETPKL
eukprot:m.467123 g.467123  ORF g.467123 m.467123 type:complete len:283 (-) comp25936_c0_seq1:56-904(-)